MSPQEIPPTVQAVWKSLALDETQMALAVGETIRPELARDLVPRRNSGRITFDDEAQLETVQERLPRLRIVGETSPSGDIDEEGAHADLRVLAILGEGGMGIVERARQLSLGREVAIKRVREDRRDDRSIKALLREALIAGGLEHPAIIPIHALGVDLGGAPLLVMKKVEGVSWQEVLGDPAHPALERQKKDHLVFHLEVLIRVCHALELAHSKGIIHLDIKPDNVMIGQFGEVYLLDWGVALPLNEPRPRQIAGTPAYMAPEMILLENPLGPKTDVYLLGSVLHQVLTGRPRHMADSLYEAMASIVLSEKVEFPPEIHLEIAEICNKATRKDPEERFGSVRELREALEAYLRHRGSIDLTEAAEATLEEVESILDSANTSGEIRIDAHRGFTEARFAFRQALRIWPENERAQAGLRDALMHLILADLRWGNLSSAAALLGELRDPPKELVEALEEAERERERERERLRELERKARALDPTIQAERRSRLMLLITLAIPIASLAAYAAIQLTPLEFDMTTYKVMVAARALPAWFFAAFIINRINSEMHHKLVLMASTLFGVMGLSVFVGHWLGATVPQATTTEIFIGGLGMALCGIFIDKTYLKATLPFITALIAIVLTPQYTLEYYILTGIFLVIWWMIIAARIGPDTGLAAATARKSSHP